MSTPQLNIDAFRSFSAFSALSDDDLLVLSERATLHPLKKREQLFGEGDDDPWIYCLMEGSISLIAPDGRAHRIDAGTDAANQPLARLKPRQYTAKALTPGRVLRIDSSDLGDLQAHLFRVSGGGHQGMSIEEVDESELSQLDALPGLNSERLIDEPNQDADLSTENYELPSLPMVAVEALRVADADDSGIDVLANIVANDPAIAAKLIKAANSPVFFGRDAIGTCQRAIVRLGLKTTRQLVVAFAMRDLFKCEVTEIRIAMERLWAHSVEVGAIAFVLARKVPGLDPGEAQLAGLLHDIGVVSILSSQAPADCNEADRKALFQLAQRSRAEVGGMILEAWNFPKAQVLAVRDAEQWWRDDTTDPELADLVVVAQLLSFIGKPGFLDLPPLTRLPAMRKLFPDSGSPELVMSLLDEASEQIEQVRSLLAD